jgi:hypothetical protein
LIVTQYFWPESFRINEIALSLREQGTEVTVLTGKPNYPDGVVFPSYSAGGCAEESWEGLPVLRVPMRPRGTGSALGLVLNYLSFAASGSVFGAWMLRRRPVDVILVYGISPILQGIAAIVLKVFKRAPVVLWVQDLWPQSLEATGFVPPIGSPRTESPPTTVVPLETACGDCRTRIRAATAEHG